MSRRWKRNLRATWAAELLAIMGFAGTFPIWPYYIQYLGVEGEAEVARWSGIVSAAASLSMGLMGPIWGILSDRHGRKMMVMRAMFGGAVIIGLMGFVRSPQQLALLRLIQGALTGTVTAATALVASSTPGERLGATLGKLQLAIFLGQSFGPVTGGLVADYLGYRATFWFTAGYLLLAGLIILTQVREEFTPIEDDSSLAQRLREDVAMVFGGSLLGVVLGVRFGLRVGLRMSSPIVPLVVQDILTQPRFLNSASGVLTSVSGVSSALAAPSFGRLADRYGGRGLLIACALFSAAAMVMQALAPAYWVLILAQAFLGVAIGGTLAIISAYIGRTAPEGRAGSAYGLDAMAVSLSNFIGPSVGGWLAGALSLRTPFYVGSALMALAGLTVLGLPRDGGRSDGA